MIIVQLAGGLGNQMFQYALARRLMSMGRNVKIDDRAGFEQDLQRNPALSVFGISYERPQEKELRRMLDSDPALWNGMISIWKDTGRVRNTLNRSMNRFGNSTILIKYLNTQVMWMQCSAGKSDKGILSVCTFAEVIT